MRLFRSLLFLLFFSPLLAFAGPSLVKLAEANTGKSLAVVSIGVENYSNVFKKKDDPNYINYVQNNVNEMLSYTEQLMGRDWKVIGASSFIANSEYQSLAGPQLKMEVPRIEDTAMPTFGKKRGHVVKAKIDKGIVQKLAKATGADFVMFVYCQWNVGNGAGGFAPISVAQAFTTVAIYDVQGKEVYKEKLDQKSRKALGAGGIATVTEETIVEWLIAYKRGINELFNAGRKKADLVPVQ